MRLEDEKLWLSPTDVTAHLACERLTTLTLAAERGEIPRPRIHNPQADLLFRKGHEHEAAYLSTLRDSGLSVATVALEPDFDWSRAERDTVAAMRDGVDVVYQAAFVDDRWRGVADFLLRVDEPSDLGSWSYEALDTKLARSAKPAYILQLCFYDEQIARLQGRPPTHIHVLLGSGDQATFRADEFSAYYRRIRTQLEDFVTRQPPTVAYPNSHCDICRFRSVCDDWWNEVDHLSRVAGIRRQQVETLEASGVTTLEGLATAPETATAGIAAETFAKLRRQAELQAFARRTGLEKFELLAPRADTGLALLPDPSSGDLFFDFEGNPFWDKDGSLEYLWGILDDEQNFRPLWAHDHRTERIALEEFIDLVVERLAEFPELHVYHYAPYEITALKRLMGRYGTREAQIDDLLRRGVFVDLYKVVRNGLQVSRPSYGLKEMEAFLQFDRTATVRDGGTSIVMFEQWMQTRDDAILDQIADYNREDCLATLMLRDWLIERRDEALNRFGPFPKHQPQPVETAPDETDARSELRESLLDAGEELAAELLDYHKRERKPVWWAFYERRDMSPEQLVEDSESIGMLQPVGAPETVDCSFLWTLEFPAQEHKIGEGQDTFDPRTRRRPGHIVSVDRDSRTLSLKRGPSFKDIPLPDAIIPGRPYKTDDQEDALLRFGNSLLTSSHRYRALESILRRTPFPGDVQTSDLDEMKQLVLDLDGQHLVIQGPPGSGKTWTCGRLISHLIGHGKRVGVASTSHKAIHNLLRSVEDAAQETGLNFSGIKKASSGNPESFYPDSPGIRNTTQTPTPADTDLVAGTAWLLSREENDGLLDYLFIDEAGQVSLADAIAMGTAARNLVLVGDPQQLDQVVQGTHPVGSDASVLKHLIDDDQTIPPDRGIFLEHTYRLHPKICAFVSREFYEGRLTADQSTAHRSAAGASGLRYLPVEHFARRQDSPEEAGRISTEIERLLAAGVRGEEIMVVSPYNAQVNLLREQLPDAVRVGTVDKFQGQEAEVVFYSLASSSGEDVPRGLEFLLSRNRFNVAVSRARSLAYLVCSPRLLEVSARTIEQMRLANALCRFVECSTTNDERSRQAAPSDDSHSRRVANALRTT